MAKISRRTKRVRPNQRLWNLEPYSKSRRRRFRWLRTFPFKMALGGICLFLLFEIFTLPIFSILTLDTDNPKKTALMQQRKEEASETGKKLTIDYRWVPLANVPQHVRKAILIAEDARFYNHTGLDWHEIGESFETNWEQTGRIVRGGQQLPNS